MLKQLTIQNYVLVDQLDVQFSEGLTTITGESGAGKSILLGALGLLLGARARSDVVRPGASKADISAEFEISDNAQLRTMLRDEALLTDASDPCLIRRVVSSEGRSRAFINGTPVTLQSLQRIAELLVDIYGQNEHRQLADPHVQLTLLDAHAGLSKNAVAVASLYRGWQSTHAQVRALEASVAAQTDRQALLTYQLEELDVLALNAGEFEKVETEQKRLAAAGERLAVLNGALEALEDTAAIRHTTAQVAQIDDTQHDLESAKSTLASALALLDDAARDLRRYEAQVVVDPDALRAAEARLDLILDLARKHRVAPKELHLRAEAINNELANIQTDASDLDALRGRVDEEEQAYRKAATKLAKARRKAAVGFAKAVSTCMRSLGITDGALSVDFRDGESERGLESIEYLVKTNKKFEPAPLRKVASGGEQTRIALSIQIVAAETSTLPCLVLDEADVGVGGTTADTVGRILRTLAQHTQIICVTHAPQVAALGHNHLRVSKSRDSTQIERLTDKLRVEELARMLAGADITAKSRSYASTLLAEAHDR